jgi:outer membrane receptor protein involved in Fe transport
VIRAVSLLVLLSAAGPALAQEETIVVTGRGLGAARGDAAYDLLTIDRDRLVHAPSGRLEDALRDIPGFQQFRRSDARSANPTSQGATFRGLGGNASSRVLLTLDGVPQSDPFGGWISWPALDPRRLGSVRAVRGGGSGADGPGALAGTIALDSALPRDLAGLSASLAYGSRDSVDAFAGYGARLGQGFLSATASFARGGGFVPIVPEQQGAADRRSPYRQASFALRAVAPLAGGVELQANAAAFTDRRERGTAFSDIATRGADASLRLVGEGGLPFSALAYVQVRDFANQFAAVSADRATATKTLDQYNVPATGLGARFEIRPAAGPLHLRLGADGRLTEGRTEELFQFALGTPTRGRVAGGRTETAGLFVEAAWEQETLTLTGGARVDRWRMLGGSLVERMLATGALVTDSAFPDRAGWEPTARAALAWRAAPTLTLRAAAYLGWRLPTLNELYRPFRVGPDATAANAALAPERLEGAEAGLDFRPAPGARLGITLFANRLQDAIANVTLGQGPGTFPGVGFVAAGGAFRMRENVDAMASHGIEVDAAYAFGRLRLAAGYSLADARVAASGAALMLDGLRPAQAPRHSFTATLSWAGARGAYASASARYVSSQYEDDLDSQRIPGALTFDAYAALPIGRHLSLEARGENLAGERVIAGISGAGIVERATPRTLWLGLAWRD